MLDILSAHLYHVCGYTTVPKNVISKIEIKYRKKIIIKFYFHKKVLILLFLFSNKNKMWFIFLNVYFNNWYTRETQPIDPFVLEGLPLFTNYSPRR